MAWKMSIDLSRPLVPSMGQHDPLDALLTYLELQTGALPAPVLQREIAEASALCAHGEWATDDPLGIGALLTGLFRLADMTTRHGVARPEIMARLHVAARTSLQAFAHDNPLTAPMESRLAFRELGLTIGLHALERIDPPLALDGGGREALAALTRYLPLATTIDEFWSNPARRQNPSWTGHQDINTVMLATSLLPAGYLGG